MYGGAGAGMSAQMREEQEENRRMMEQMKREKEGYEQRLREQNEALEKDRMEKERLKWDCHFKNINEDPLLSGTIKRIMYNG